MAFSRTLGAIATTATLALMAVGTFSTAAAADDGLQKGGFATNTWEKPGSGHLTTELSTQSKLVGYQAHPALDSATNPAPSKPLSGSCSDAAMSGPYFAETCDGTYYYTYIDCSDGNEYVFGPYSGRARYYMSCPSGYNATGGGWYS
ncbi:hypothetical protein [Kitasatospora brasiliensis]|uniref:hypothetical protein n=1 Tax=Kitasatospora brasiliensis TaxID=3058040 RepID=UPI00292DD48C|nr:hypothetical protein [Kitasatospora sp. K002]